MSPFGCKEKTYLPLHFEMLLVQKYSKKLLNSGFMTMQAKEFFFFKEKGTIESFY